MVRIRYPCTFEVSSDTSPIHSNHDNESHAYFLQEENKVLREALRRTESERASLRDRINTLSEMHSRSMEVLKEQHRLEVMNSLSIREQEGDKANQLSSLCEEYRVRMNALSHALSTMQARLSRVEKHVETQHLAHEAVLRDFTDIHKNLVLENSRLHSELLDHNS